MHQTLRRIGLMVVSLGTLLALQSCDTPDKLPCKFHFYTLASAFPEAQVLYIDGSSFGVLPVLSKAVECEQPLDSTLTVLLETTKHEFALVSVSGTQGPKGKFRIERDGSGLSLTSSGGGVHLSGNCDCWMAEAY
jgi:hypothetical protein